MAETTAQLKRKRESAIGLQKKAKKQRKSDGVAVQDAGAGEELIDATSVAPPTPKTTSKTHDKTKAKSQKPQKNTTRDQDAPTEPADEPEPQTSLRSTSPAQDPTASTKKKSFKERVQESKEAANAEMVDSKQSLVSTSTKSKKPKHKTPAKWTMSPNQGGWFLPTDPVFSMDEKYLILANPKALQIYFTETSLLANVLPVGVSGFVTSYALSPTKPTQVYVADSNGLITLWDWVDGTKIGRWDIGATVRNMAVITQPGSDEDLVYCHETSDKQHIINVHALRTKSQASKTELKRVLKTNSTITNLQVILQGKYVVIATPDSVTVGKRLKVSKTAVQEFEYVWRELKFSKRVTTCHMYFRQPEALEKGKRTAHDQRDVLDLAVGDEVGVILLFEDILASFAAIEIAQKGSKTRTDTAESLRPKRFHWHRDAVGSVKWSLDGNYFISGGDETVLNIWQLATGKAQHLPHLTAAIENIVVSPSGSSYAVSLANNSVIVISTAELDAKTNIVGIQTRRVDPEQLPKEMKSGKPAISVMEQVPLAVDPNNTQQLLFSVPSSQPRRYNESLRPQPYLQTFDIANQRPVARQALTRNNATDPNMGPEGQRIVEPNVKFLQVSHDGQWLATVDEWLPPQTDTGFLNEGNPEFSEEQRMLRRETYLKMWRRDEKNGQWVLETRIDAPHFLEDVCGNGRVQDLVAHPTQHAFASIGEDHVLQVWKPKTRLRDGIVVRGADDKGLVTWSLHRSVALPQPNKLWLSEATQQHARTSRLAYSPDGSILAAGISGTSEADRGLIHLIDADSAIIRRSMPEIDATALCNIGIVGRYMVAITDSIIVWDLVYDNIVYCASITTTGVDQFERTSIIRLATSEADGTFAVSLPQFEQNENPSRKTKKALSKIFVYSTNSKEPLWYHTVPGITLGLVARKGETGYIALDSVSCIRTIIPTAGSLALRPATQIEDVEALSINDAPVEDEDIPEGSANRAFGDILLENEYDMPVVRQQDLENIFHNDNAPQAPKEVFSAVLRLFGGVAKAAA